MTMSDKSAAKAMFTSLCSLYEGNKKVREAKATMLVHQYELFRMKEDESIETTPSDFLCSITTERDFYAQGQLQETSFAQSQLKETSRQLQRIEYSLNT